MILTCPRCATRYLVEDDDVGPAGRKVRCSACGDEWRAFADADPPLGAGWAAIPEEPAPAPEEPPSPSLVETPPQEPLRLAPPPTPDEPNEPAEAPTLFAPIAPRRAPAKRATGRSVLIGLLIALVIALLAAFALRDQVVRAWPGARAAYAAFGLSTPAPGPAPPHG
jgi:predicted Zn finger-like uncharacterized protein